MMNAGYVMDLEFQKENVIVMVILKIVQGSVEENLKTWTVVVGFLAQLAVMIHVDQL